MSGALPPDHPAWAVEARALARGLANLVLTLSPERIVMGGGVMQQGHLFPLVHEAVRDVLGGYVPLPDAMDAWIVPPRLGGRAGVLGALALAAEARDGGPAAGGGPSSMGGPASSSGRPR